MKEAIRKGLANRIGKTISFLTCPSVKQMIGQKALLTKRDMQETSYSYLRKQVANTKNFLTRPSAGQIKKDQETTHSSPRIKSATPQKKADRQTEPPEQKSKKRHIPFIALALVMLVIIISDC